MRVGNVVKDGGTKEKCVFLTAEKWLWRVVKVGFENE
jgi:hypothetical protein